MPHSARNRPQRSFETTTVGGFTLIELLVVIAIIGLLASLAVPAYNKFRQKGYVTACGSNLRQVGIAAESYFGKYRMYPWTKRSDGGGVATISTDDDARKCLELLYKFDYLDNPEVYICPSSQDQVPDEIEDRSERRDDFFLDEFQCSYTWRYRPVVVGSPSTTPVSGDKRGGESEYAHHSDGRNVLFKGGKVEFFDTVLLEDPQDKKARKLRRELIGFGGGDF
jgi:prepilin-type N-terminal cleavage/methylation domain-containing protein